VEVAAPFLSPTSLLVSQNGRDPLEWVVESGLKWSQGLCYQAVAAAQFIADGRTESPLHSLDDSIAVLAVLEEARSQLGSL
ncbi:MAG: gfo/Idh/MocA family oxidoreductase, partial [Rhodoglobus sp.]